MAGIGFELRKLMRKGNYLGLLKTYTFAGLISSGPWVISILGILVLGILALPVIPNAFHLVQFQTSITNLIAASLILTGLLQHGFTRFIADEIFAKREHTVMGNFNGALFLTNVVSGLFAILILYLFFYNSPLILKALLLGNFVVLCNMWIATFMLSGLKNYRAIVLLFALGYSITVTIGYQLSPLGLKGLLLGFLLGHVVLLTGLLISIYNQFPGSKFIRFDFLRKGKMYTSLIFTGLFFNLGIWADKYVFWFHPATGEAILGPFHGSIIYDLPIFLAYLAIIPGMAIFLLRMEADFVDYYQEFYDGVREGDSLQHIEEMRNGMVNTAHQGIFEIVKVQGLIVLIVFALGGLILKKLSISSLYINLLKIDVIAASLQVVFLSILNILFYLDKRAHTLYLSVVFFVLNVAFSLFSIKLGPFYFGYGFAAALLLSIVCGMLVLDYDFEKLEFQTFMLQ